MSALDEMLAALDAMKAARVEHMRIIRNLAYPQPHNTLDTWTGAVKRFDEALRRHQIESRHAAV